MVNGHHKRHSSSDDSDEEMFHKRKRKEKRRRRSKSPEDDYHRSRHHRDRHRSRSMSSDELPSRIRIKPDPDGPREDRVSNHRIKQERDSDKTHGHRDYRNRDRDNSRQFPVKQEPRDETSHQRQDRRRNDERRRETYQNRQQQMNAEQGTFGSSSSTGEEAAAAPPKDAPNFELSGKLTEDTNTYKGVVIKYNEPPEARKPKKRWRLYPFKNDEALKPFHMHRQSAYLFGRDRLIADIPVDHPSCSKQHAVFQYRLVPYEKEDGRKAHKIAPYLIDLGSANGTYINNKKMEPQRYYELFEKDVIKFGYSSRDYVLLHDKSDTTEVEENSE